MNVVHQRLEADALGYLSQTHGVRESLRGGWFLIEQRVV